MNRAKTEAIFKLISDMSDDIHDWMTECGDGCPAEGMIHSLDLLERAGAVLQDWEANS